MEHCEKRRKISDWTDHVANPISMERFQPVREERQYQEPYIYIYNR